MKYLLCFLLGCVAGAALLWIVAEAVASGAGHLSRHVQAAPK